MKIIIEDGHSVTLLDSFDHPDLATLLATHDFLLIPELEDAVCSVSNPAFISPADSAIIRDYVEGGGKIFIAGGQRNVLLLNSLFSLSLGTPVNTTMGSSTKTADATGTIFDNCPDTIPNTSVTFLITTTMPASKKCIYQDQTSNRASIALFNIGAGYVVYLGYDFFDSGPDCDQKTTAWTGCLIDSGIAAATFGPTGIPPATIPTLSQWGLILLSISLSILGVLGLKTRVLTV